MRAAPALLARVAAAVVAVTLVATVIVVLATVRTRTLDGVEGDVLFEAKRIRDGLALWVSPATGATEYGPPPSRYYVLYPPLWSAVLSRLPEALAPLLARVASIGAWGALLVTLARRIPPSRRPFGLLVLGYFASSFLLASYATAGRPDGVAVVLAGLALARAARLRRLDVLSGVLFALAAWSKPNVVGAVPGVVLALVASGRAPARLRRVASGIVAGVVTTAAVAAVLGWASGGAWLEHLLASTVQPPDVALLATHLRSRAPMFALPFGVVLWLALRAPRKGEGDAPSSAAVAGAALSTSLLWCLLSYAKIGSAANYLLEPAVCAIVACAHVDLPSLDRASLRLRLALAGVLVAQVAWTCTASLSSAWSVFRTMPARSAFLEGARAACGAGPDDLVLADEPGLEMTLNGRLVQTPFQATQLARRGRFPVDAWLADLRHPRVACLVAQDDLLERDLRVVDPPHDLFPVEARALLRAQMELVRSEAGLFLYRRRR